VGSSSSTAPITAEAAILDYISCHVVPVPAPAPPVITVSDDEDDEIDWRALMAEE